MICPRSRILTAAVILLSLIGHPLVAVAQKTTVPANVLVSSPDKPVIKNQLQMAARLGRKALAGFEATSRDESVPIDENVRQAARDTYALIRSARHGLELSLVNQKFPDPIDQLNFKKLTDAWDMSRYPVDKESWAVPRAEYLLHSTSELRRAMQVVDQVLLLMP
jgi:hypothetical protein